MKIYEYNQNNSGGSFVVDSKLCHRLYIEANYQSDADEIAEEMGVYFNGCDDDMDCPCCGDRWYSGSELNFPYSYGAFSEKEGNAIAEKYNCETEVKKNKGRSDRETWVIFDSVEKYVSYMVDNYGWTSPDARIFYSNGDVKEFYKDK